MSKRGRQFYKRGQYKLHLGPWLARDGRKPVELAKALGVTDSYISELISGRKPNPGHALLIDISEWLGITVNDLFRPPPEPGAVEAVERLPLAQQAALARLLDEMKSPRRR